ISAMTKKGSRAGKTTSNHKRRPVKEAEKDASGKRRIMAVTSDAKMARLEEEMAGRAAWGTGGPSRQRIIRAARRGIFVRPQAGSCRCHPGGADGAWGR